MGGKEKTVSGLKVRPAQKQERQNREQEGHRGGKEGICQHQGLDSSSDGGKEGPWPEGLRCREEGHAPVRQGKGSLQEVMHPRLVSRLQVQNAVRKVPALWSIHGAVEPGVRS